jgi:hypothetical protein
MSTEPARDRTAPAANGRIAVGLLLGALLLALAVGILSLQAPTPTGFDAAARDFSAARAMVDVREIAQRPHPVGSAENGRVRGHLMARMTDLGLNPEMQLGLLSPAAEKRMARWGLDPNARTVNLIGVLPGVDMSAPAVLLMAHYDTTVHSPGAADDSAGVAAVLETVRAIKARGPIRHPLVVLLTDGEELNLDGARTFFSEHPWRERLGAVINLEARGGGGRAMMFETGPGNRQTIDVLAGAVTRAPGGVTSNSLAVVVYENMPNGTDFTLARQRALAGMNFAFIGRPEQYHAEASTPDNLDQGALQHIGGQALEATDALVRTPALPVSGERRVYADVLGRLVISHAPQTGWMLFGVALVLTAFGLWGARHGTRMRYVEVGHGLIDGLWLISAGLVMTKAIRLLAGPLSSRAESAETYYTLLRRLPWIEGGAVLTILAAVLFVLAGRPAFARVGAVALTALSAMVALAIGGVDYILIGAAVLACGLGWFVRGARSSRGGWIGVILLVTLLGGLVQALSPEAAFILLWPALLGAGALAISMLISARLVGPASLVPPTLATILGGAWIVSLAHPVFLGIGMDMPGVLAPLALLILVFAYPLGRMIPAQRSLVAAAAACLILGAGVSIGAVLVEPDAPSSPT